MRQKKKRIVDISKRPGRTIDVDGVKWKVQIGVVNVVAYSELGEKKQAAPWDLKGLSPQHYQRGQWKITKDGMLTPKDIVRWLKPNENVMKCIYKMREYFK
jgi:hypothetical protein